MSLKPLVSVIIPTYNRAKMVGDAIQSVLNQTYTNKEIIVVDDGSTDNTEEVVKAFQGVKYIRQAHSGQAAARNNGWRHSTGSYISTLDSDDLWYHNFLETNIEILEKKDLDFVFSNWYQERMEGGIFDFFDYDQHIKPYLGNSDDTWVFLEYYQLRELYLKACASPSSSLVIRSTSLVQGWNEKMNIGDDWCMLLDIILKKNAKAAFTRQKLWQKRLTRNNIYDGRDYVEVVKLLWVKDLQIFLSRYKEVLTEKEYKSIEKIYLKNLIENAKHSLLMYLNIRDSMASMRRAIFTNPLYTSKVFSQLFIAAAKRRLKLTGDK